MIKPAVVFTLLAVLSTGASEDTCAVLGKRSLASRQHFEGYALSNDLVHSTTDVSKFSVSLGSWEYFSLNASAIHVGI